MHDTRSTVAVIIPAYNAASHIGDTIKSVVSQTRPPDEILVVDDGSSDNTAEVAAKAGAGGRLSVVRKENGGQGSARQRGVLETKSKLLLFLDADDVLEPMALQKLAAVLEEHPQSSVACCQAALWSPTDGAGYSSQADNLAWPGDDVWSFLLRTNCIRTPGCVLIRREALNEAGGWDIDPRLRGHEDWEFWLRLAERHGFVWVREPLLKYRSSQGSFSKSRPQMYRSCFLLFAKHRARWKTNPGKRRIISEAEWNALQFFLQESVKKIWSDILSKRLSAALRFSFEITPIFATAMFGQLVARMHASLSANRRVNP